MNLIVGLVCIEIGYIGKLRKLPTFENQNEQNFKNLLLPKNTRFYSIPWMLKSFSALVISGMLRVGPKLGQIATKWHKSGLF